MGRTTLKRTPSELRSFQKPNWVFGLIFRPPNHEGRRRRGENGIFELDQNINQVVRSRNKEPRGHILTIFDYIASFRIEIESNDVQSTTSKTRPRPWQRRRRRRGLERPRRVRNENARARAKNSINEMRLMTSSRSHEAETKRNTKENFNDEDKREWRWTIDVRTLRSLTMSTNPSGRAWWHRNWKS